MNANERQYNSNIALICVYSRLFADCLVAINVLEIHEHGNGC
jgi:hypothetical protein